MTASRHVLPSCVILAQDIQLSMVSTFNASLPPLDDQHDYYCPRFFSFKKEIAFAIYINQIMSWPVYCVHWFLSIILDTRVSKVIFL